MEITLLRHATTIWSYGGKRMLVDPMLDEQGARPAIVNTANEARNPLVALPDGWEELVGSVDAALVSHLHADHFDDAARRLLKHDAPTFCQPEDIERLTADGFSNLIPVDGTVEWDGISITRTGGQHGTGEIGKMLAPVSGFVLRAPGEPVFYSAGDTIWCAEVEAALRDYRPEIILLSAGGAQFLTGGLIIMDAADVAKVREAAPDATIVVVHLDAINHCHETREPLRARLAERGVTDVLIPEDGEAVRVKS